MRKLVLIASALLASNIALAEPAADCASKAVSKEGKPLAGAARTAFLKKCQAETQTSEAHAQCAEKAVTKDGKPLAGAARASFMKKCVADAK